MDIKVEEEEILSQDYQQNIISSNVQREKTLEANKQVTKDSAKDFESISALSRNYYMTNDNYDDNNNDGNEEKHECTLCERLFPNQKLFKAHIKKHLKLDGLLSDSGGGKEFQTIIDPETKNEDHPNIPSKKSAYMHTYAEEIPYKCLHCPKKFPTKHQFKKHMYRHKVARRYKCEICSKSFPYPSALQSHKRAHRWERPFKCETCSTSFYKSSDLKKHMNNQTGDHSYKCEICLEKFCNLRSYKIHMRVYTNERPYQCEICLKSFKCLSQIPFHKLSHIKRPFQCDQCPEHFTTKEECKNHALKH